MSMELSSLPFSDAQKDFALRGLSGMTLWISAAWLRLKKRYEGLRQHLDNKLDDLDKKWEAKFDAQRKDAQEHQELQQKQITELQISTATILATLEPLKKIGDDIHHIKNHIAIGQHVLDEIENIKNRLRRQNKRINRDEQRKSV